MAAVMEDSAAPKWDAVPCDAQTQGLGGWVLCLQTSVASVVRTVAYDMDSRRVVMSTNGHGVPTGFINGKGVIPLLPHEIPSLLHGLLPRQLFPANLAMFHNDERGAAKAGTHI